MSARIFLGLLLTAGLLSSASAKKPEPVASLSAAQLACLFEGYPVAKSSLPVDQTYRAHVSLSPCEVELAPEREGKGGGALVRIFPDAGFEVLRTK